MRETTAECNRRVLWAIIVDFCELSPAVLLSSVFSDDSFACSTVGTMRAGSGECSTHARRCRGSVILRKSFSRVNSFWSVRSAIEWAEDGPADEWSAGVGESEGAVL